MGCTSTKNNLEKKNDINKKDENRLSHGVVFNVAHDIEKEKNVKININNIVSIQTGTPLDNYYIIDEVEESPLYFISKVKNKNIDVIRSMNKLKLGTNLSKEEERNIEKEIENIKGLDHPNISKLYEFYSTESKEYYSITEYFADGNLFNYMKTHGTFDEAATAYIMYQILSVIFYCHSQNIVHRDIKPNNIFITSEDIDTGYLNVKISDFGICAIFDKREMLNTKLIMDNGYFVAPEILKKKYTEKCDIWSCGVITYILLCGRPPFDGKSDEEIQAKIRLGKFDLKSGIWSNIGLEVKELIRQMLDLNVLSRISAQKALSHRWFKKFQMRDRFVSVKFDKLKKSIQNIKKHKANKKLTQIAWAFIVHNAPEIQEIKDIQKVFKKLDVNGDGRITKDELGFALGQIFSIADNEDLVDEIFRNVDNDNNGFIEYEEYIRASIDKEALLTDEALYYTFKFFDKDGSGKISISEIGMALSQGSDQKVTEELTKALMEEVNMDDDNEIDFEEFKVMMRSIIINENGKYTQRSLLSKQPKDDFTT